MAVRCDITGKTKQFGNHVSFSQRKVHRTWKPNLHKKRLLINGKKVTLKVSAQGLRSLRKKGVLTS